MPWIVMSSGKKMPSRVQAPYRNIALVEITDEYASANLVPKMISTHARGVKSIRHLGHYHVGKTPRGAFQKAFYAAETEAAALNQKESSIMVQLDARELATILAGLRCWQKEVNKVRLSQALVDIATNNNNLRPMRNAEIDELCARLHTTA